MAAEVTVSLDAMGGDEGANLVIPGAAEALTRRPDIRFRLYGDQDVVLPILDRYPKVRAVSEFEHCDVTVRMDDTLDINERAEKTAKSPNAPAEPVVAACMLLARFTRRLRVRGQDVNDDPESSVFSDPALQEALGVPNAWRAVRELFMVKGGKFDDGVVNRLALALLTEGGLSRTDGVEIQDGTEDPT